MVKGAVKDFLRGKLDKGLESILFNWIDAFLDLATNPAAVRAMTGMKVVGALGKGGADLLGWLKPKLTEALPAPVRELAGAVSDDLRKLIADVPALTALMSGPP